MSGSCLYGCTISSSSFLKAKKFFVIKRFHSYIMQMIMAFFNDFYLAP
ncbi:hypothetical protein TGS27_1868 [Geobacillus stearothermophilus]|uniref:Uncharacterized protein n=1 Tax=Geobacillus stearothermophilus TaxID=1422 RepID=A0A150MC80_GEOSE|nr:hypothetical protein GS8_3366 [Geobacillus stearothermophilus]KYD22174.1 hypothetical protein B4109_0189 [Geobacillus stearothermophilus]OAO80586.1 hypothetical protein TGS27_1868 [Geobacillus stearothermophilus]